MVRYDEMTIMRFACLQVVADAGGEIDHEEMALAPFSDDRSTLTRPDVFNQCHEAGWLVSFHDDRMDSSYAKLTDAGRLALKTADRKQEEPT